MDEVKDKIISLLINTNRVPDKFIDYMDQIGFWDAPCSTNHHLSINGGLALHSLNVYELADKLAYLLFDINSLGAYANSIVIVSLLHDIGKCGQFGKPYYVENMIKEGRVTKSNPEPKLIRSEKKPYLTNAELFNVPHEIRSLSIIDRYIDLTEEEQFAILYHNGLYGPLKYELQGNETPLYLLLHFADMWCSRVIEQEEKECEE